MFNEWFYSGSAAGVGYQIPRSLRFNSSDSAYLSRTPASTGNRTTSTFSLWVKRCSFGTDQRSLLTVPSGTNNNDYFQFGFSTSDQLRIVGYSTSYLTTSQVFRDPSAWAHILLVIDTSNAIADDRLRLYVNGTQVTDFATRNNPSPSQDLGVNRNAQHQIGIQGTSYALNAYLADIHFIDGQALDPTSFTEVDATTGQLIPKAYTGSYGTNGFHLPFSDNSTAAALGTDTSGAGNDWDVYNISVIQGNGNYTPNTTISTGGYTKPLLNGFDGNTSTATEGDTTGSVITVPVSDTISAGGVRVYAAVTASNPLVVNIKNGGTTVETFTGNLSGGQWYASSTYSGAITALEISRTGRAAEFNAIEVNGTVLVDYRAGSGNDSLVDTPTNYGTPDTGVGGEVRGNYATWNPLSAGSITLSNGNLSAVTANQAGACGTVEFPTSGKWYFELTFAYASGQFNHIGIIQSSPTVSMLATTASADGVLYRGDGNIFRNTGGSWSIAQGSLASYTANDVIGVAVNGDSGTLQFYKNGASVGSAVSLTSGRTYAPFIHCGGATTSGGDANFGQRPFAYAAPSGFKALCTTNLPDPVVAKPSDYFNAITYSGNSGDGLPTTQDITTGFSPDFVWIKSRSDTNSNILFDIIRGAGKRLFSNLTNAEDTQAASLVSFNSDGFTVGGRNEVNDVGVNYISWTWDAGSSTVSNTDGSITSQVRANPSAGFSVVKYNLSGTSAETIGHGLNSSLGLLITKCISTTNGWAIWHSAFTGTQGIAFNTSAVGTQTWWDQSNMTSSVFAHTGGTTSPSSAADVIAYCWAPVDGYSSFGSYTGNGSADGPFVFTGFRPRWVMIKGYDASNDAWKIYDTSRSSYNVMGDFLSPNNSNAEVTNNTNSMDMLSNGFKMRSPGSTDSNYSGYRYIYCAFAESPFRYSRAR